MRATVLAASVVLLVFACGTDDGDESPLDALGGAGAAVPLGGGSGTVASGGAVTGGAVTGGAATGGAATGGAATGGAAMGGAATGGAATGGAVTGGAATGGAVTGGWGTGAAGTGAVGGGTGGAGGPGGATGGGETGGSDSTTGGSGGDCTDSNVNCRYWAGSGECQNNPGYMLSSCCASCRGTGGDAATCSTGVLDCGSSGVIIENAGPPSNRVNYVVVGDCYTAAELDTTYLDHIETTMAYRFGPFGEPYARYRKFVNICALKVPSNVSGCSTSVRDTAFRCYGSDSTRLGLCDDQAAYEAMQSLLPSSVEITWTGIVMNDSGWWNSGGQMMIWSGGHPDAPTAALHEGGHGFHGLADEYTGTESCAGAAEPWEINVTRDPSNTAGKWSAWLGFDQAGLTGPQSTFEGARYCTSEMWRPSDNSMMNMCFASYEPTNAFNSISREKMVRDIYAAVRPIDCFAPTETTLSSPQTLSVTVVDPEVIKVDWSVDGSVVSVAGGATFDVAARQLSPGQHTISVRAYDDTDLVRGDRSALEQRVTWTVTVP